MTRKFSYMADFGILKNTAVAGGTGLAFAGGYLGAKYVRGELKDRETASSEIASNLAGGLSSGLGGYLLSKVLKA